MNDSFSDIIKQRLKMKNMKQKELASRLNVTDQAVSKWVRGISLPDVSLFSSIAKELDIPLKDLYEFKSGNKKKISKRAIIVFVISLITVFLLAIILLHINNVKKQECKSKAVVYETADMIYSLSQNFDYDNKTYYIFNGMYRDKNRIIYSQNIDGYTYISRTNYLIDNKEINDCLNSDNSSCLLKFKENEVINKLLNKINNVDLIEKGNSSHANGMYRYDSATFIDDKTTYEYFWRTYLVQENGRILYFNIDLYINNKSVRSMKNPSDKLKSIILQLDSISDNVLEHQSLTDFSNLEDDTYYFDRGIIFKNDINAKIIGD